MLVYNALPVLVLSAAIVCVQAHVSLSKAVVLEVVVEERDDAVSTFPYIHPFINDL